MLEHLFCAICQAFKSHQLIEEANEAIVTCEDCGHALKFDPASLADQLDAHNAANAPLTESAQPQAAEEASAPAEAPVAPEAEQASDDEDDKPAKS